MTTEIVSYSATEAAIAGLSAKYAKVVFDVTKPEGMADAKSAYKEINTHSITLEAARKKEKAESLEYGRKVDAEAARIAAQLDVLRLPIKAMIETETKREEREREAKVQAEIARLAAEEQARKDAEEARMAADRAELARRQEEVAKAERESRDRIETEERAARAKIEEEERQARLAQQARDDVARQKREAEERRLKEEADRVAAARRDVEERERAARLAEEARLRKEREAQEAVAREALRKKNESLDGWSILSNFVKRYAKVEEFDGVVADINKHLKKAKK